MTTKMDDMCRTCMRYNAEQSLTKSEPNNRTESNDVKLLSMLYVPEEIKENDLCLKELLKAVMPQLRFEKEDNLPKKVCLKCSENIINFYNFQLMCLENEEKLYKLLEFNAESQLYNDTSNYTDETMVKDEVLQNYLNQKEVLENIDDEKEIENVYCSEDDSKKSDILSPNKIDDNICPLVIRKEKKIEKKSKRNVKKKLNKNPLKRSNRSIKRNPQELYSCDKCQRKLKSEISLVKHQELHLKKDIEEKELKCNTCNQVFPGIVAFKEHQRTHTSGEKTFLCSECGKGFASAGSLKQHSFRHLDKKLYPCPDCPKSFPTNGDLSCHYETHKAKPRIHVCNECGRGFYKPFLLKQHQRYHNDERPFACEFCEKRFVTSEKQRRHMRTHTGEKPYPCKYCDRAFAQSGDCVKHLRQHLGENVYQCELCPLRFPMVKSLRAHFASHKDEDDETRSRNLQARKEEERNLQIKFSKQDL